MRNTRYAPIALIALLVGCSTSEAASTTTTSTTTTSTTTTSTTTTSTTTTSTTTVPPTTVPPPPVSSTAPVDPAVGEITARINQFWPAWDACRVDPSTCDIDGLIAEFATPDSRPAQFWRGFYGYMGSKNAHMTQPDKIENYVASINATGSDGVSEVCERNGAVLVAADGSVLDDTVGLTRFEWIWSKVGGKWMIVGGSTYEITDQGDAICDAYFK